MHVSQLATTRCLFGDRGSYFDARFFTMVGDLGVFSCCIAENHGKGSLREVSMLLSVDVECCIGSFTNLATVTVGSLRDVSALT